MTGGFGAWGNPDGGFNWNMLTNVGAGMLANAEYGPMQAFGKGYNKAMEAGLDQQKAQILFQEQENKRRAQQQQQRLVESITNQMNQGGGMQPAPAAGGMLQPPPVQAPEIGVGYNDSGPNPAAANASNTNMVQGIQQRLMPQGGAPAGGAFPTGEAGGVNIMGMQVSPQAVGAFKMYAAAGDYPKAFEALANGNPEAAAKLQEYYNYVRQQVALGKQPLDQIGYIQATKEKGIEINSPLVQMPGQETKAYESFDKAVGEGVFAAAAIQAGKAGETKGLINIWQKLQQVSGNSGQFDLLRTKLGPWAQMMGFNVDTTKMSYGQAMEAIVSKMAPGMRIPGSGNTSDRDIMLFLNGLMKLSNTPEANALITSTLEAVADAQMEAGNIAMQWRTGELKYKEAMQKLRDLDPFKGFKERAAELGVDVTDMSGGVKGGGSTTPGPAAPKPKLKIDPKTMKVVPFEEEQGWLNPSGNNMGYSSGVRG